MGKYQEIMEHIEVTEEMRSRICRNVEKTVGCNQKKRTMVYFKRYLSIAASLILLLVGGFMVSRYWNAGATPEGTQQDEMYYWNGMEEAASAAQLTEKTGIEIEDIIPLKEMAEEITYYVYSEEMVEINYISGSQSVSYRKSIGEEDNSGVYQDYAVEDIITVSDMEVTMKGDGQSYYLAIWTDGTYSYSLWTEEGMEKQELTDMIYLIFH